MADDSAVNGSSHRQCVGGVLSRYAPHFLLFVVILAIGILLVALGLSRPTAGTLLPGALFMAGSCGFLVPMVIGLSRSPRSVQITREGVQWQDSRGEHRCSWADITAVFRVEKIINQTFRVRKLRLLTATDEEVTFDQCLSDYDQLADTTQTVVAERLLPAKRAELTKGQAEFGPVILCGDGIILNARMIPWSEIEQFTIVRGCLLVYHRDYGRVPCEQVILGEVPNYQTLLLLLHELGHAAVPPQ